MPVEHPQLKGGSSRFAAWCSSAHGENGASSKASIRPAASLWQAKEDVDSSSGGFVGASKFCDAPAASKVLNGTMVASPG